MFRRLPLLVSALTMLAATSCSAPSRQPMPALPPPPARAAQPCPPLPDAPAAAGEVVVWVVDVTKAYADCDGRRRTLAEAWPG